MKPIKIISAFAVFVILLSACNNSNQPIKNNAPVNSSQTEPIADSKVYQCSMHPHIIKSSAGSCPICGMELEQKTYHQALMFLSNYKKEHTDYKDGDSLLNSMTNMKGM